jgi:hypothetical protein
VSVQGEFQRILGNCLAVVRRAHGAEAARWTRELETAARQGSVDLTGAAQRVLAFFEMEHTPELDAALEREELTRQREHLTAICRAIVGS